MKTKLLLASSALLAPIAALSIGVAPAWAQDANPSASAPADSGEILVTARRREESIQDVPVAVVAFGQQALEDRQIRAEADLQRSVPGLTIRETEGSNQIAYSIRGQTIDAFTGSFLAVVPYVNEVQANGAGGSNFYDLQSIQVLKGPQGTLFGRNSTGGAVLIATGQPTNEIGGKFSLSYGNFNAVDFKGMINLPIIDDKVLLRIAGNMARRDGYQKNIFPGMQKHLGKQKKDSIRGTLTIKPSDSITNTTMVEYTATGGNSTAVVPWSVYSPGEVDQVTGLPLNSATAFLYGPGMDVAFGFEGAWAGYLAAHPGADPLGYVHAVEMQKKYGAYKVNAFIGGGKSFFHGRSTVIDNATTFDIGTDTLIKNIFGYSKSRSHYNVTEQGAPFWVQCTCNPYTNDVGNLETNRAISDELQLQGKAFGGNLEYILGAFYYKSKAWTHWPQNYFEMLPYTLGTGTTSNFMTWDDSKALFAQASYHIGPQFTLTGGFRYTWEKVRLDQLPGGAGYNIPGQFNSLTQKFKKPSWTIGVDYKPTDNLMVYVVHRGSWRSGGINGVAPMLPTGSAGGGAFFKPETAKDVELGLKWNGDVGGRPAHFNVAVYKQWIKGVQRAEFPTVDLDGPGPEAAHSIAVTINVPKAVVKGFEIDGSIRPADFLELGGNVAYTNAKYTDNEAIIYGNRYVFNSYADTPRWAGTVYAVVTLPLDEADGTVKVRGEFYKQSGQYFSNNGHSITPRTFLPKYNLVNARLDWSHIMGSQFSAALFGTNLTNKGYYVGGLSQGPSLGENSAAPGRPRFYGAEVSIEF